MTKDEVLGAIARPSEEFPREALQAAGEMQEDITLLRFASSFQRVARTHCSRPGLGSVAVLKIGGQTRWEPKAAMQAIGALPKLRDSPAGDDHGFPLGEPV